MYLHTHYTILFLNILCYMTKAMYFIEAVFKKVSLEYFEIIIILQSMVTKT